MKLPAALVLCCLIICLTVVLVFAPSPVSAAVIEVGGYILGGVSALFLLWLVMFLLGRA
jgi:hypothetical protein